MKIKQKPLKKAINRASKMSLKDKETVVDEIYTQQPNLLASVLVQQQLGNALAHIDILLNILIVSTLR